MQNRSLSKDRNTTLELDNSKYYGTNFETITNRSPSDLNPIQSVKNSEYFTNSIDKKNVDSSFNISPNKSPLKMPSLRNINIWSNTTVSPKKVNLRQRGDSKSMMNGLNLSELKRDRFNIKEVLYSDVSDSYRQPTKSITQILKENNDEKILKQEITLFDNFNFPKDMRLTSNLLEMHPQILKDKLRISKFIHRYFNPTLYQK